MATPRPELAALGLMPGERVRWRDRYAALARVGERPALGCPSVGDAAGSVSPVRIRPELPDPARCRSSGLVSVGASGAFFLTDSMPFKALAFELYASLEAMI